MGSEKLLIGAHTSVRGGLHQALLRAQEMDATTLQIFTSNQKQWKGRPISSEEISLWKKTLTSTGIQRGMSHGSYLINLGSHKEEILTKSCQAFREEIERSLSLDLAFLNFHPGAATGDSEENCLNRIVDSLLSVAPLLEKASLRLLIETTAGQGTHVGYKFEHLGYLIERTHKALPIGVCLDTCHVFASGYDIRDEKGWDKTLNLFDQAVGLKHLYALHLNDSMHPLGSRRDRHASLGEGQIGEACFRSIMRHPKLFKIPKYLETPDDTLWKSEIRMLKNYALQ